jgi:DNA polymerase elongation subunit (family B)
MKEQDYAINRVQTYNLNSQDIRSITDALKTNKLKFHQFYNTDISGAEQAFLRYLSKFKYIDDKYWELKKLNKTYYDIETFFDPTKSPDAQTAEFPINSISFYNNIKNEAFIYFLKDKNHKYTKDQALQKIKEIYQESINKNKAYLVEDIKINFEFFNTEKDLIIAFFRKILELNTMFLIGFNSMLFDDPYTLNRLIKCLEMSFLLPFPCIQEPQWIPVKLMSMMLVGRTVKYSDKFYNTHHKFFS